ncbi:transposase-like protein [Saccharopolyspora lacisalsi]|uniref:Transposase-like protein n=1 Tax=Halosaccharopolyspora lacisalsi TaxID=1000566 RepID=A0A839E142_9PSEU|nr:helix-turn-helix domain-containing protein [Halosaccharopolyspora lacisalsi]MBA8825467.1 transposase-like protein [Halosaccharopolyspora lacisalsi]
MSDEQRTTPRRGLTAAQKTRAAAEYEQGQTIRTLAASYQVSYGTMHRVIRESGVAVRPRGGDTRPQRGQ